jgi:hypothetical protein
MRSGKPAERCGRGVCKAGHSKQVSVLEKALHEPRRFLRATDGDQRAI